MKTFLSTLSLSEEQTLQLAYDFGKQLPSNSVVCFYGDLGAGKTTFIKGLATGAADYSPLEVNSPTFVFLNIYEGTRTIYHFDLYRLHKAEEFLSMGFDETLESGGICCIEWAERIHSLIPPQAYHINIQHHAENGRQITITQSGLAK